MSHTSFVNEAAAVHAARRGERAAFEWLVRRHQQRALAVAIGVLHNIEDARDACQEAFLRAFRGLDRFDGQSRFSTWLYRIVVNLCIDRLRGRPVACVALEEVAGVLAAEDDPFRAVAGLELGERIGAALAALTPAHRTTLVLREVQGLSYQEIAAAMQCSVGTVMSRLFNARRRMQALLATDEEQPIARAA